MVVGRQATACAAARQMMVPELQLTAALEQLGHPPALCFQLLGLPSPQQQQDQPEMSAVQLLVLVAQLQSMKNASNPGTTQLPVLVGLPPETPK